MEHLAPARARRIWAALALFALGLAAWLVLGGGGERVRFAQGVQLLGLTAPREVVAGGTLPLTLSLRVEHALPTDEWVFVHVEALDGGEDVCRMVHDQLPSPSPTRWSRQTLEQRVELRVPDSCKPGRYEIYTGLYDRDSWERLPLLEPKAPDQRAHAGFVRVVRAHPDSSPRTLSPRQMRWQDRVAFLLPWLPWALGISTASVLVALARLRRKRGQTEALRPALALPPASPQLRKLAFALVVIVFLLGILVVLEFVKDDAYISFRYAHNLVTGQGLVFNSGERLEGFTNFLWVLILVPFEALGLDLFQVCEVLGSLLGIACLWATARLTGFVGGEPRELSQLWGALWLATSSSFVLWAKSGLEQPLAALLPIVGALVLWRARDGLAQLSNDQPSDPLTRSKLETRHLQAGLLLGAGCMTRPELHLLAILIAMPLLVDALGTRSLSRAARLYAGGVLLVTAPCHAFRYLYYGTLVPNTFYVKTGTGELVWRAGVRTLHDMFVFNRTGLLVVLAPLAFASAKRTIEKFTMALCSLAFMVYYVRVGVDEMQWHRLYLPALPFLCVLAALGLQNLIDAVLGELSGRPWAGRARLVGYGLGWAAVIAAGANSFRFTYREMHGFDGHGDLAGTFHPDLGKFLVRHERPGALVAFQDMGSTPYHAPDLNFLDFIGLVDRTVAHARHDFGLHAFVGSVDAGDKQKRFDSRMREYFFQRNPEWTILTIYTPPSDEQRVAALWEQDPTGASLGDAYRENVFQFGLWDDPRFAQRYVAVRTWQRSVGYYLALWRRRDLWERTPREVVLQAPPSTLAGARAELEGGLTLLGSDVSARTVERGEAFVTTWWKLPGPMPHDLMFFVHVTGDGFQLPADHVPGDWMYPADRWQAGQTLEDRTLVQLPPFSCEPGRYRVYLGAYRKSTGERLRVLSGSDGDDRILLGTLQVDPLYPLIHQLIPPTRVQVMRKHADRITDSGRRAARSDAR